LAKEALDYLSFLLAFELLLVELELLALEDVTVGAATLSGAGREADQNAARAELCVDILVNLGVGVASGELGADVLGGLGFTFGLLLGLGLALLAELAAVMLHEPGLERGAFDLNDGTLDEGLGADQFVVGGVVDDIQDTGLAGDVLGAPGEIAAVQTEGAELEVATAATHGADTLATVVVVELGHGRRATELELALLLMDVTATACKAMLVPGVARDTHLVKKLAV